MSEHADSERSFVDDLVASGALVVYSAVVAAGFARVFEGWNFLDELLPIVVVGHGFGLLTRRRHLPAWVAVPVTLVALGWLIAVFFFADTLAWGLPTTETWQVFRLEMAMVREQFPIAVAPVLYGAGWDVLAAIGISLAVVLADTFAFRAFARAESLVPGGVLFIFVGAVGADRLRVALTVALVAAGTLVVIVLRWYHAADASRHRTIALRRVAPAAVVGIVVIALGAGLVGPRLPGATAAAVYDTRGGSLKAASLVSPLVDIRSRLTNRSQAELFRVNADIESYWRSTALPEFDGTRWTHPNETLEATNDAFGDPGTGTPNRQRITIVGLEGTLVPAAPEPYETSGLAGVGWVAATSTLLATDGDLAPGDTIDVMSAAPHLDAATLAAATSTDAGDPMYTELPDDLPPIVAELARRATAGAQTPYEAARLLQAWFHREFDYSLRVQPGHGNDAIETFLRERVGYCEQFAGTYAAMMRTLGYPTRVAVGFTSGSQLGDRVYVVRGRNAHAWPEVWFDGIGWVAFEPTPGRGAPNAEAYTGLPPQQDESPLERDEAGTDDGEAIPPPVTTTAFPPNLEPFEEPGSAGGEELRRIEPRDESVSVVPFVIAGLVAAALALPWIVRRVRRRHRAASAEAQLARVWRRALDTVGEAGVRIDPSDTPLEAADATARALPLVARPFSQLAEAVTDSVYAPEGMHTLDQAGAHGATLLRRCHNWARQIERSVGENSSFPERVHRYFTVWR